VAVPGLYVRILLEWTAIKPPVPASRQAHKRIKAVIRLAFALWRAFSNLAGNPSKHCAIAVQTDYAHCQRYEGS